MYLLFLETHACRSYSWVVCWLTVRPKLCLSNPFPMFLYTCTFMILSISQWKTWKVQRHRRSILQQEVSICLIRWGKMHESSHICLILSPIGNLVISLSIALTLENYICNICICNICIWKWRKCTNMPWASSEESEVDTCIVNVSSWYLVALKNSSRTLWKIKLLLGHQQFCWGMIAWTSLQSTPIIFSDSHRSIEL